MWVEFGSIQDRSSFPGWNSINELEMNSWRIILIAFLLLLILIKLNIKKIRQNKVPILLKIISDIILYYALIFLIKKAGWDSSEDIFIIGISFIVIAPLLHKLSEIIIIFLAEHIAGATVSSLFELLNLNYLMGLPDGVSTPLGKMTFDLRIALIILCFVVSIVLGIVTHKIYESKSISSIPKNYWNAILILIFISFFIFAHLTELSEKPKIVEFIPDSSAPLKEDTAILWTATVENKRNDVLFRFLLNGRAVTNWTPQNQWLWNATIGDNHIAVEVKDAKNREEDYYDDIMNTTIRIWPNRWN